MAAYSDDPLYQQWLGTLGFLDSEANRQADDARTRVTNQADYAREGAEIDRDRTAEAIGGNFENRGLTRSGEHLRRQAESLRDSNRRFGAIELDTSNRYADIENQLARELANLQLQNMGYEFDATGRAARRAAEDYDFGRRKAFLAAGA